MMLTRYAEEEDAESLLQLLRSELDTRLFTSRDWETQIADDVNESTPCQWLVLEDKEQMVSEMELS